LGYGSDVASHQAYGSAPAAPADPWYKDTVELADKFSTKLEGYAGDVKDVLAGKSPSSGDIAKEAAKVKALYLKEGIEISNANAIAAATESLTPGPIRAYGPSLAIAGLAGIPLGFYDDPEDPDKAAREEAAQRAREAMSPSRRNALLESDPDRYMIRDLDPYKYRPPPNRRTYQGTRPVNFARAAVPPPYLQNNPGYARYAAADGGFIDGQPRYPRREMLVEGPGTERSDDIPAMLSDGEFVLNSRSVRGADPTGQGNRYRGAQNLYNMMRNFEMRG